MKALKVLKRVGVIVSCISIIVLLCISSITLAVLFRFNTCDYVEGGIELPEAIVMAKMLEEAGVDALHCTQGMFTSKQAIIAPGFVPVMHYAENAAAIKRSVNIPILAVGRYNDIYMSEAMLRDDKADFIVMAARDLISAAAEFTARVEDRINDGRRRNAYSAAFPSSMGIFFNSAT